MHVCLHPPTRSKPGCSCSSQYPQTPPTLRQAAVSTSRAETSRAAKFAVTLDFGTARSGFAFARLNSSEPGAPGTTCRTHASSITTRASLHMLGGWWSVIILIKTCRSDDAQPTHHCLHSYPPTHPPAYPSTHTHPPTHLPTCPPTYPPPIRPPSLPPAPHVPLTGPPAAAGRLEPACHRACMSAAAGSQCRPRRPHAGGPATWPCCAGGS